MAIVQISKIQQRAGNLVDLPQLDEAEFGWASDQKRLFIGKTTPNENIEVMTTYSSINYSQLVGSVGNLNISNLTVANGQILTYDGNNWVNRGGDAGGLITLGNVANVKINGGAIGYVLETDGLGNLSWTPKSTVVAYIQNVTKANPGVVTTTADNFLTDGLEITITNALGMTELNGKTYYANVLTSNTFSLYSDPSLSTTVNTTGYTTYSYTAASATTVSTNKITVSDNTLFALNEEVRFTGGLSTSGLKNNVSYYVKTKPTGGVTVSDVLLADGTAGDVYALTTATLTGSNMYGYGGRAIASVGAGAGGSAAAGSNTTIQFNNSNLLDGDADFTWNFGAPTKVLGVTGNANVGNLNATGISTATRFISNIATNTPPLTVTSTTPVANLAANVSIYGQVTTQTSGTFYPVFVNGSTTANYAHASNASLSFNAATGALTTTILNTTANANITGNLNVTANANITANASANNISVGNILLVGANANVTGNLNVTANANVTGRLNVTNIATFSANANITGNLNVTANANITANASANNISVGNILLVGANANVTGNLNVTANANITANLTANNGSIGNILLVGANANITGNLNVTANANITANASANNISVGNILLVGANANVIGNLNVTANANITANLKAGNANVTSLLVVGANANVTGNLNVTANANVNADLNVDGNAFIIGNVVTGHLSTYDVAVTGNLDVTANVSVANRIIASPSGVYTNTYLPGWQGATNYPAGIFGAGTSYQTGAAGMALSQWSTSTTISGGAFLSLNKSNSATIGTHGAVAANTRVGAIGFSGSDGAKFVGTADIISEVDGSVSTGVVPGRLIFATNTGAGATTEQMRIDNNGNVGIGNTAPVDKLSVTGTANISGNVTGANVVATSYHIRSIETGIVAAGSAQSTATALTKEINVISTVASGANGVRLPTGVAGMVLIINNTDVDSVNVYPDTGSTINGGSLNAAYSHTGKASLQYYATSATKWYTVGATFT